QGRVLRPELLESQQPVEERGALTVPQADQLERALFEPEMELMAVLLGADRQGAGLLIRDQVLEDVGQRDRTDVAFDSHEISGFRRRIGPSKSSLSGRGWPRFRGRVYRRGPLAL